jgi:hypothetical protein
MRNNISSCLCFITPSPALSGQILLANFFTTEHCIKIVFGFFFYSKLIDEAIILLVRGPSL